MSGWYCQPALLKRLETLFRQKHTQDSVTLVFHSKIQSFHNNIMPWSLFRESAFMLIDSLALFWLLISTTQWWWRCLSSCFYRVWIFHNLPEFGKKLIHITYNNTACMVIRFAQEMHLPKVHSSTSFRTICPPPLYLGYSNAYRFSPSFVSACLLPLFSL